MSKLAKRADIWHLGFDTGMMLVEAQSVIFMRVWGMAGLWPVASSENKRMVNEKTAALTKSAVAAGAAMLAGKRPDQVASAALRPIRARTRSNSKRLAKRGSKSN